MDFKLIGTALATLLANSLTAQELELLGSILVAVFKDAPVPPGAASGAVPPAPPVASSRR